MTHTPEGLPSKIQHYIDGEFVDSISGATFDVLEPAGNTVYTTAAAGQEEDIDRAVAAATAAFENGPWPRMLPRQRSRILNRIADLVEAQDARLAELETFDTGLEHEPLRRHVDDREVGDDAVDARAARERQGALGDDLGRPVLRDVLHGRR